MEDIILFFMSFALVYLAYQLFIVRKAKKKNAKKKPIEVIYLVNKYRLDLDKINYKLLLQCISIVSSLDISLILSIVFLFDNYFYRIISIIVLVIPTILLSYHIVGTYYIRKGLTKNV